MQDDSLSSYYSHLISAVSAAAAAIGRCRNDELDAQNILEQHISLVWKDGHSNTNGPSSESSWSGLPPEPSPAATPPWAGRLQGRVDGGGALVPKGTLDDLPQAVGRLPQMANGLRPSRGYSPLILQNGGHPVALSIPSLFSSYGTGQSMGDWTQRSTCGACGGQCGHRPPMTSVSSSVSVRRVLREVVDANRPPAQSQSSETENTFQRQPTPISNSEQPHNQRHATKTTEPYRKPLPPATVNVNSSIQPPASSSASFSFSHCSAPTIIVGYYYCDEPIPYRTTICGTSQPTLAQFKQLLTTKTSTGKNGQFRYFFKKASNEFEGGVVREEIRDDHAILPLWEGKIVCKIERSS